MREGNLKLSTDVPSLENYSQSFELGFNSKIGLPSISATISYQFFDYQMKTEFGDINLSGQCDFKCTCKPEVPSALCLRSSQYCHDVQLMREKWESTVFIAASSIALGGAGFYWNGGAKLAAGLSALPVGVSTSTVSAREIKSELKPFYSEDRKVMIMMRAESDD